MMYAPSPMPPMTRTSRPCYTCVHAEHGAVSLLCLYGTMANKCADNRSLRGLCGPSGHMWRIRRDD